MAGRTKVRLAAALDAALREAGYQVKPIDPDLLMEAKGADRTSGRCDNEALRWEAYVPHATLNIKWWVTSFVTMTDLLRLGLVVVPDRSPTHVWIEAAE